MHFYEFHVRNYMWHVYTSHFGGISRNFDMFVEPAEIFTDSEQKVAEHDFLSVRASLPEKTGP